MAPPASPIWPQLFFNMSKHSMRAMTCHQAVSSEGSVVRFSGRTYSLECFPPIRHTGNLQDYAVRYCHITLPDLGPSSLESRRKLDFVGFVMDAPYVGSPRSALSAFVTLQAKHD